MPISSICEAFLSCRAWTGNQQFQWGKPTRRGASWFCLQSKVAWWSSITSSLSLQKFTSIVIHWCFFFKTVGRCEKHPNVFAVFTWRGKIYWTSSNSLQTKTPKHCDTSRFLHWQREASSCLWVCRAFVAVQCYAWWCIQATFLGVPSPHCYRSCPSSRVSILIFSKINSSLSPILAETYFDTPLTIWWIKIFSYLHSSFSPPIAHSDLKATNILLDEELTPRIADCGLASLRPLTSNSVKLRVSEECYILSLCSLTGN